MSSSPLALGIDFGTTKTIAALCVDGQPRTLPNRQGKIVMPSRVVAVGKKQLFVGWETETLAGRIDHQILTINAIKRTLGKQGETKWGDWGTRPQEIAALLFGRLKIEVEATLQTVVEQAVIAIPAHFDINQREAIQQSAQIAGFKALRLLNEATATALTYSLGRRAEERIMVFDFGGGTLDVSIVEVEAGHVQVLGTAGDGKLGGEDLDYRLLQWVEENLQRLVPGFALKQLPQAQQIYLQREVTRVKETLSTQPETRLFIHSFLELRPGKFVDLDLLLTRTTLNTLFEPFYARIKGVLQDALETTKTNPTTLQSILAIGGSSRIPRVEALIQEVTGHQVSRQLLDPQTCVAQGAALQAGILQGSLKNMLLLDTLPADFSVGMGEERQKLFTRAELDPARAKETFVTAEDNVHTVTIPIYEHYPGFPSGGNRLGSVQLTGLPPAPKGVPKIEVAFDVNADGLLTVAARDVALGKEATAILTSPYRLNETQMRAIRKSIIHALAPLAATSFAPFTTEGAPFPSSSPRAASPPPPASPKPTSTGIPPPAGGPPAVKPAPAPRPPATPRTATPRTATLHTAPPLTATPLTATPHTAIPPGLAQAQAEARHLTQCLLPLEKPLAAPLSQMQIPLQQWRKTLTSETSDSATLKTHLRETKAGLTLALPALFIQHTQTLANQPAFQTWLTNFEERWVSGEAPRLLFSSFLADFAEWQTGFEALVNLSETLHFPLTGMEAQFTSCRERLTFILVLRRLVPHLTTSFPHLLPQPDPLCVRLLLAWGLNEFRADEWEKNHLEILRVLAGGLPPLQMAGVLIYLDRTHPPFSLPENLRLSLEACSPSAVAEAYLRLPSRRKGHWHVHQPVRVLVRSALIRHLRQTTGATRAATRAALQNFL